MRSNKMMAVVVGLGLVSCGPPMGEDFDGPYGIKAVNTGGSYAYVVPVEGGVVLVDTGGDEEPTKLKDAIAGRPLLGVLITHSHTDHVAGALGLGGVEVFMGREDIASARGMQDHKGLVQRLTAPFNDPPAVPARLVAVDDGFHFSAGGETFVAVGMPGHTPGSMAYVFKDVLFSGDAVFGGDNAPVTTPPFVFSDDTTKARQSLAKVKTLDVTVMLDGHNGKTDDPKSKLDQ